tara:strand:- start:961 stop:1152 length:192 start_codon:yes stop_codon:yes gene_type:complete
MDKKEDYWDKLIALLVMDMIKKESYSGENKGDEKVGDVERDLAYEYQMDRVKLVSGSNRDTKE